jgi:hypothetical protein
VGLLDQIRVDRGKRRANGVDHLLFAIDEGSDSAAFMEACPRRINSTAAFVNGSSDMTST